MRTEPSSPLTLAVARLRVQAARARQWVVARGPIARMALLVVALAALATAGYLATPDASAAASWAWIFENRHLSRDDIARIRETLEAQGIPCYTDRAGRIGVKAECKAQALAVLAKGKVAPPTLNELDSRAVEPHGLFDGPEEIARRERILTQQSLKMQIETLDPSIDSAFVRINRFRSGGGFQTTESVSGYVHLTVNDHRELPHKIIDGIQTILTGSVPELRRDAITLIDQRGRAYLSAGNRELTESVSSRAREEVWRDAIHEALRHIPGVDVRVQLETPQPPNSPKVATETPTPSETVRPNMPVAVAPDPPAPAEAPPAPARPQANVWVRVPRSYYLMAFESQSPNRKPGPEDLKALDATTRELVDHAVRSVILSEDLGHVETYMVQDDLTMARPPAIAIPSETRSDFSWAVVSGAVGALGMLAGAAALHLMSARRPSSRPAIPKRRADFATDEADGSAPGPSERVRELIRLDPEAAAGALQRWIGQGEATG
ncbi:hypothetical protein TA3x_003252 [Tundrisphaera sp. TA3]|uniref:hypothetical protein n=1 Tax=Tundrisphaera sp. TA3 TaxID=3435775 RepID=UPI003EBB7B70